MNKKYPVTYVIRKKQFKSIIGSLLCLTLIILTISSIIIGAMEKPSDITPERGERIFMLFTVNSNLVSLASAICTLPYCIDGIKNKWHRLPKWVDRLLYCGTVSVSITFIFAMALILPRMGAIAVTGMNFGLHVICPIIMLILFFYIENTNEFTFKDSFLALMLFYLYSIIYFAMVVVFHRWRDIYNLMKFLPAPVAIIAMYSFAFLLTFSLRLARNYFSHKVSKKLSNDLLGIENLPEYYDAYVAISQLCNLYPINNNEITIPLDLIEKICDIYPDLTYREAINHYVDISLEKDKIFH